MRSNLDLIALLCVADPELLMPILPAFIMHNLYQKFLSANLSDISSSILTNLQIS